jgi:uncharacterized protein with HEPN domain
MPSNRTPAVYFADILHSIELLEQYTQGVDQAALHTDTKLRDAILHRLLIVTEAAHRLKPEDLDLCPDPDWRNIRQLGNVIRHVYDAIDLAAIWNVLHDDLPPLKLAVEQTLRVHFPDVPRT